MQELNEYSKYSVADFAMDYRFQEWVLRGVDDDYWNRVMQELPDKKEEINKAVKLLRSVRFTEEWPPKELVEKSLMKALNTIEVSESKTSVIPLYKKWWAVAAAILILVGGGWLFRNVLNQDIAPDNIIVEAPPATDVEPGGDHAVLTLADGSTVVLDHSDNGLVTEQGGTKVMKIDGGTLSYNADGTKQNTPKILYNTVNTPRGGQYRIVLPDGTKVWLNSISSIKFPTEFTEKERKVEITGEVYFEVAHNPARPFEVKHNDISVRVLGTHFNVNTYEDEPDVRVTLLEGAVQVADNYKQTVLKPGQQAVIADNSSINILNNVSVDEVVAWKDGKFLFNRTSVESVMRMLSRWYDMEYEIKGNISKHFGGSISRDVPLSKVVEMLKKAGGLDIQTNGNKLIITQ